MRAVARERPGADALRVLVLPAQPLGVAEFDLDRDRTGVLLRQRGELPVGLVELPGLEQEIRELELRVREIGIELDHLPEQLQRVLLVIGAGHALEQQHGLRVLGVGVAAALGLGLERALEQPVALVRKMDGREHRRGRDHDLGAMARQGRGEGKPQRGLTPERGLRTQLLQWMWPNSGHNPEV